MSETAISIENLSKLYLLGQAVRKHDSLAAELGNAVSSPFRNFRKLRRLDTLRAATNGAADSPDLLWALKDVSLEVKRGEVMGFVGRNGAGKSTLLKILSRITEPTSGRVRIRGRVASLLEVGTGFHPDLTGRENIYLNGTILGMTRREVDRKFDEIVDFSGVERFLDTPVKRYSSGMKVRLGFAVAAHLDPDILIIDEVLAVGDADFQRKCIARVQHTISNSERCVLFVSHSMTAVNTLCTRCAFLENGQIKKVGSTAEVTAEYFATTINARESAETEIEERDTCASQFKVVRILGNHGNVASDLTADQSITFEMVYQVRKRLPGLFLTCQVLDAERNVILMTDSRDADSYATADLAPGIYTFRISLPPRLLGPGKYYLTTASAASGQQIDKQDLVVQFNIQDISTIRGNKRAGFCGMIFPWSRVESSLAVH